ncbi:MAG: TonB-dependent receptor [Methylococcales bacterium]
MAFQFVHFKQAGYLVLFIGSATAGENPVELNKLEGSAGPYQSRRDLELAQSVTELEPVLVTAPLRDEVSESTVPVNVLKGEGLRMKMGHSIGETLKQESGITSQSFGPGVGTPVIRGQTGPRVRVLANGIGSNDASAISPDHATSTEPLLADRIEVLRGPATLLYGSGAIGGVVNIIDNRIPENNPEHLLGGAVEQRYDSASNEESTALKLDGGQGPVAMHLDGFYRQRNNIAIGGAAIDEAAARAVDPTLPASLQNSFGVLLNSSAHAVGGSAGASWIGDAGFAGASINRLKNNYGIPPDGTGNEITRIDLRQNKYNFKSELEHPFAFAESLRMRLGYTDYHHTEIANVIAGSFFTNKTYEGRVELTHQPIGPLRGVVGFQAISSDFSATDKSTGETLVPRSQINHFGVFAVEAFDVGTVAYQFGVRAEDARIDPRGLSGLNYIPVSASGSGSWKMNDRNRFNLAITRSQRAPQVQELLTNGFHDATRSFEVGNINLTKETSYNLDLGYRFKSDWLTAEVDLFYNWVDNYIFQQRNGQFVTEDGDPCPPDTACSPVLVTRQSAAIFKGFEGNLIFPVMENHSGRVDLTLFGDYTRGQFDSGVDVPRMPPLRYGLQLDYARKKLSAYLRVTRAEAQNHPGEFDTSTSGYVLLNLGLNFQVKAYKEVRLMLFAKGSNLLNQNIRNSTSYLRNFAPEPGRGAEAGLRFSY